MLRSSPSGDRTPDTQDKCPICHSSLCGPHRAPRSLNEVFSVGSQVCVWDFFFLAFTVILMVVILSCPWQRSLLCWSTLTAYNTISFQSVKLVGVKPWTAQSNCPAFRTMGLVSSDHMPEPLSSISVIYTSFTITGKPSSKWCVRKESKWNKEQRNKTYR